MGEVLAGKGTALYGVNPCVVIIPWAVLNAAVEEVGELLWGGLEVYREAACRFNHRVFARCRGHALR